MNNILNVKRYNIPNDRRRKRDDGTAMYNGQT